MLLFFARAVFFNQFNLFLPVTLLKPETKSNKIRHFLLLVQKPAGCWCVMGQINSPIYCMKSSCSVDGSELILLPRWIRKRRG